MSRQGARVKNKWHWREQPERMNAFRGETVGKMAAAFEKVREKRRPGFDRWRSSARSVEGAR